MKDIFNNIKFDSYLYGGISDLEEEVGVLVYSLYQIPTINPIPFSCGGHLGSYHERDWKVEAKRDEYIVTSNSYISYKYLEVDNKFEQIIRGFLDETYFSKIENGQDDSFRLLLSFDDLVEEISKEEEFKLKELEKNNTNLISLNNFTPAPLNIRKREVNLELAIKRQLEIKNSWDNLNEVLKLEYNLI